MKPIMAILAAAGVMGSTLTVSAQALLRDLEGSVLVNIGEGFVRGVEGQSVPTGARVMTGPSSAATIVYAPCRVVVGEAVVVTIAAEAPCGDRRGCIARAGVDSSTRCLLQAEADGYGDTAGVEVDAVVRRGAAETASASGAGAGEAGVGTAAAAGEAGVGTASAASAAGGGGAGATAAAVGALAVGTTAAVASAVASFEDGADPTPISP